MNNGINIGGSMKQQHERTLEMLAEMKTQQSLAAMLWFLYDTQTTRDDLKMLAVMAEELK
jgi:hypothetical protein